MTPEEPLFHARPCTEADRQVFISYPWGTADREGARHEAFVDRMCAAVESGGFVIVRDREKMKPGDSIRTFMEQSARSPRVILLLNEKYLKSECCVFELDEVYRCCYRDRDFQQRVIPITLPGARISSPEDRLAAMAYWEDRVTGLRPDASRLRGKDHELFSRMEGWSRELQGILSEVANLLHPVGYEAVEADGFSMLLEMLQGGRRIYGPTARQETGEGQHQGRSTGSFVNRFDLFAESGSRGRQPMRRCLLTASVLAGLLLLAASFAWWLVSPTPARPASHEESTPRAAANAAGEVPLTMLDVDLSEPEPIFPVQAGVRDRIGCLSGEFRDSRNLLDAGQRLAIDDRLSANDGLAETRAAAVSLPLPAGCRPRELIWRLPPFDTYVLAALLSEDAASGTHTRVGPNDGFPGSGVGRLSFLGSEPAANASSRYRVVVFVFLVGKNGGDEAGYLPWLESQPFSVAVHH